MLDLTTWNLSVPTDPSPTTIETPRLNNGYESQYMRRNDDGSLTFWVPVDGSHTADARNPRSELRETQAELQKLVDSAEKNNVHFDQLIAQGNTEGQQLVRDAIAALVKQTGAIEQAAGKLGISDLNPDTADHEF